MPDHREANAFRRSIRAAALVALAASAAACEAGGAGVRDAMGVSLKSPDAFNVYPRQPLRMPPSLDALPAPDPGAPSPLDPQPQREAQAALAGAGAPRATGTAPSAGEQALLASAGADQADPNIRAEVSARDEDSPYALSSLFGFQVPDYPVGEGEESPVLDSREESRRILDAGGTTPSAPPPPPEEPTNEYVIGDIF